MLQTEGGYHTCAEKRMKLAEHLRYLPMGYYNENSLGRIMSVTTNTVQNLENVATRVVVFAHRLKTVHNADQILGIENGRIAQQGTHDSLMAQDGIYRTFVESRLEAASWRL